MATQTEPDSVKRVKELWVESEKKTIWEVLERARNEDRTTKNLFATWLICMIISELDLELGDMLQVCERAKLDIYMAYREEREVEERMGLDRKNTRRLK